MPVVVSTFMLLVGIRNGIQMIQLFHICYEDLCEVWGGLIRDQHWKINQLMEVEHVCVCVCVLLALYQSDDWLIEITLPYLTLCLGTPSGA